MTISLKLNIWQPRWTLIQVTSTVHVSGKLVLHFILDLKLDQLLEVLQCQEVSVRLDTSANYCKNTKN